MTMNRLFYHLLTVFVFILCYFVHSTIQQNSSLTPNNNNDNDNELPANVTIPRPDSETVISEENEVDKNRTGILQWILGIAGFTTTPPPAAPEPPPIKCPSCTCGLTNKRRRIVGGHETQVKEYPWMILLRYRNRFYCGAALINNLYLLTAAHCTTGFQREFISALFLEHDRSNSGETKTFTRTIKKVLRHKQYNNQNYDNDIALMKLNEPVQLEDFMRPVCLPSKDQSYDGEEGIVTGWGAVEEGGALASKLQEVTVPILSNVDCKKTAYGSSRITVNMLCAGYPKGTKDSCQGDSGGPLHVVNDTKYLEVGIVSWGEGCAGANRPGVYTRVSNYLNWIKSNTVDACYC